MFLPILEILAESYGPLRIFNYLTFRAILATLTSLIFAYPLEIGSLIF